MARKRTNLYHHPKTRMWWYRVQVPADIRSSWAGSHDIRGSLGTKDRKEAERKLNEKLAELQKDFDRTRKQRQADEQDRLYQKSEKFRAIIWELVDAAADAGIHGTVIDPVIGPGGMVSVDWDEALPKDREAALRLVNLALDEVEWDRVHGTKLVLSVDDEGMPDECAVPPRMVEAVEAFVKKSLDERERLLLVVKARVEARAEDVVPNAGAGTEKTFDDLLKIWCAEKERDKKSVSEMKKSIGRFLAATGQPNYGFVTKYDIRNFKTALLEEQAASATKKKAWSQINTLYNIAIANDMSGVNPMAAVHLRLADDSREREDFNKNDYEKLFAYLAHGEKDWWFARILTYTGARLAEVHQLTRKDVRKEDGVLVFDFNEDADKSLKTKNSIRKVPVHNQLIIDGLETWLPKEGAIFSGTSDAASKRLNRAIRKAGVEDPNKVVHSMRHTFISAARDAGLPEDVRERLTGHTSGKVGRKYGTHSMASLKTAIDKVKFGIELEWATG